MIANYVQVFDDGAGSRSKQGHPGVPGRLGEGRLHHLGADAGARWRHFRGQSGASNARQIQQKRGGSAEGVNRLTDLVLPSRSGAGQNNQPPSPVLHVVQEARLARLDQARSEMGRRQVDQQHL